MNRFWISIICLLIVFSMADFTFAAAELGPQLTKALTASAPDAYLRVVIEPRSTFDRKAFRSSLAARFESRAERHRAGIAELKQVAEYSQAGINVALAGMEKSGEARSVRSFWIGNLVEAEIRADQIADLATRPDIERIVAYPKIVSVYDSVATITTASPQSIDQNLQIINVRQAWNAGYDGSGRLVCSFDTGVEGDHPALVDNYRGNNGYSARESWFPGVDNSTFPHSFPNAGGAEFHGTATTGIMCGHQDATGDTIGVAPGAQWIAAVAIDVPGASIFEAFQWAVDPDGNPNTSYDVPDVINHSWGVLGVDCEGVFDEVIDNTEALGIVNIFAAGNEGPDPTTIRNPANRAVDSITNFAVGAIWDNFDIWSSSSRGPSDCDGVSVKPNVVAPGVSIRTSTINGLYASATTGTSFAAPHVSGAVAILRQKNPNATVEEIKNALLTTASDLGILGPDYDYGWGVIDIGAALNAIAGPTEPNVQVRSFTVPEIFPGDQLSFDVELINVGSDVTGVTAQISNPSTGLSVLTPQINYGTLSRDFSSFGDAALVLDFDNTLSPGEYVSCDFDISGNGGSYTKHKRLSFLIGPEGERSFFDHDVGQIQFTVSNFGSYGFYGTSFNDSYFALGKLGFQYAGGGNDLYEGALFIGTDSAHVSDGAKNIVEEPDNDFAVLPGGTIQDLSPGTFGDQESLSSFDDSKAENPIGISVQQHTYSWADPPNDDFVILRYILTNTSGFNINGIHVGLYLDWDLVLFTADHGSFDLSGNYGYLCYWNGSVDSSDFRGVRVLNPEGMTGHYIFDNALETYGTLFDEGTKYRGLSSGFIAGQLTTRRDASHVTSTGPFNLAPGQSDTAAFAIVAGNTWADFAAGIDQAEIAYSGIVSDVREEPGAQIPASYRLEQNAPNPFNPETTISFSTPRAGRVTLDIFDILGRKVVTLHDGYLPAGRYSAHWNGKTENGDLAASGVYLYRLVYPEGKLARKMVLMK